MSDAPAASQYWKLNVCCGPVPEFGVTPTTLGTLVPDPTVQLPTRCQSETVPALLSTHPHTFLEPTKLGLNAKATFTVRVLPAMVAEDCPTFRLHWLFCSITEEPMVAGPIQPLSATSCRR